MKASPLGIFSVLLLLAGCGAEDPAPAASVSGTAGDLKLGSSPNSMAGTFWGADDGLNILITDARDPCAAWTAGRREPNTSALVLGFLDALEPPTSARAGDYVFVDQPFGAGLWFRVIRAFRLDDTCTPTAPGLGDAVSGGGKLDDTVPIPGGLAAGSFSANFAQGSLHGTFSAPFCDGPANPGPVSCKPFAPDGELSLCACQ